MSGKATNGAVGILNDLDANLDERTKEAKRKGAPSPLFSEISNGDSSDDERRRYYRDLTWKFTRSSSEENDLKISARAQKKERAKGDHKISSSRQKLSDDRDLKPRAKAKVADQGRSSSGTAAKAAPAGVKTSSSDTRKVAAKVSSNRTTGQKERKTQPATGRASAESKPSSTQAKKATTLDSKSESASTRSLTCQKEGCNTKLTGTQQFRCTHHTRQCKKKGCVKQIKDRSSGVCRTHVPQDMLAVTKTCQKEGCKKTLTGRYKNRCEEHQNLCRRENCRNQISSHSSGLCYGHELDRKPPALKTCQKEGCNKTLTRAQRNRCEEHRNLCSKKDCNNPIKISGLCRAHAPQKPPTTKGNKGQASNNRKDDSKKEGSNTKPDHETKTSK